MADNKNMALDDDMMALATGGEGEDSPTPKFNIGDKVRVLNADYIDEAYVTALWKVCAGSWIYHLRVHDIEEGWMDDFPGYEQQMELA